MTSPNSNCSWNIASKSNAELTADLKDAHARLKEKERDLHLAAEIGKSLLENNIKLKGSYEELLVKLQHQSRQRQQGYGHSISDRIPRIAPPNTGLEAFPEEESDWDNESDNESTAGYSSGIEMVPNRIRTRSQPRIGMSQKDYDNIRELEFNNTELQARIESLINENKEFEKTSKTKIRHLEADIQLLYDQCSQAADKIETLEHENQRLQKKQSEDFWNLKYNQKCTDNDDVIDRLLKKVKEFEDSNHSLERTKIDLEKRLNQTKTELNTLQEQHQELQQTAKDYVALKERYDNQAEYVTELRMSLEEQRMINLGMRSGMNSRPGSFSEGAMRRVSDPDAIVNLRGITPAVTSGQSNKNVRPTLLDELESQWYRELSIFQRGRKNGNNGAPPFSPVMSESDFSEYYTRSTAMSEAGEDIIDYMSEDEFTFLEQFKEDDEKAMLRREWFFRRWARIIYKILRLFWRWCRFLVLLIAAVMMALYRGPDAVLSD
ncbi:hypothetical protein G9A89_004742 [Geosiphon pyriformis]|nr:hypothetical protein G9A89_004742 [Geosiphon pyriformis]